MNPKKMVVEEPRIRLYHGCFLDLAMRAVRVTSGEVRAAVRADGYSGLVTVRVVVIETGASFSAIGYNGTSEATLAAIPADGHISIAGHQGSSTPER